MNDIQLRAQRVAVVICTWNKRELVLECIQSVLASNYQELEIIVVDNDSTDGTADAVSRQFPNVKLIVNSENLGGAGGFNTGLNYALEAGCFDFVHLLDNDTLVAPDATQALVDALQARPSAACCGSKIMLMDEPHRIQELGAFLKWSSCRVKLNQQYRKDRRLLNKETVSVDYVPACSMMVRVSALRHLSVMDYGYFLYFDDIEWCTRFKRAGYEVIATHASVVWHKGGGREKLSHLPLYYWVRNEGFFFNQYLPDKLWRRGMRSWVRTYAKALAACSTFDKPNAHSVLLKGIGDLRNNQRGRAPSDLDFSIDQEPSGGIRELFRGESICVAKRGPAGRTKMMLEKLLDSDQIHLEDPDSARTCDIYVIPVSHVLGVEANHDGFASGAYLVDPHSNVLPPGSEGKSKLHEAMSVFEQMMNSDAHQLLADLHEIRNTSKSVSTRH